MRLTDTRPSAEKKFFVLHAPALPIARLLRNKVEGAPPYAPTCRDIGGLSPLCTQEKRDPIRAHTEIRPPLY